MLYLCPVYGQDKVEKCLIYPLDMPEISLWYAWDKMTALNQTRLSCFNVKTNCFISRYELF